MDEIQPSLCSLYSVSSPKSENETMKEVGYITQCERERVAESGPTEAGKIIQSSYVLIVGYVMCNYYV